MLKPITIAGGGLAGLALGLGLRRHEVPVTLFEAGYYPRHRVCGEFISGKGRAVLAAFGLEKKMFDLGAREAATAAFFSRLVEGRVQAMPHPALCLSRHKMDHLLAYEFREMGGKLLTEQRWRDPFTEGIVRATGRRTQSITAGWRWFGLKAHARNISMSADLEMHLLPQGYVGLCRLDAETVNLCGLFRSHGPVPDLAQNWPAWLKGPRDSFLHRRLENAELLEDTFCSVAGLPFPPQRAIDPDECRVGDAITMIAPLTGNGMSMAFESAELAIEPLRSYSRGILTWAEACQETARRCGERFRKRLRWSARLQNLFLCQSAGDVLVAIGSRSNKLWRSLFQKTR